MFFLQTQGLNKAFPQFREKIQGPSKESNVPFDGPPTSKTTDGLVDNSLKNRGGKILPAGSLIDQRLNIGFGKDTAAGSNGIHHCMPGCCFVQTLGIRIEQDGHLIDKSACTAGTGSIHLLLYCGSVEGDFSILPSQFDSHIGFGNQGFDRLAAGYDFLFKGQLQNSGQRKSPGSGNHRPSR